MTPEQLKASILQLAIQGKLVPQRPEEGTAEELNRQIQREKKNLTAAGKLKKEKPLPPISEDEIPFDIPDSWKWVRLGELLFKLTDGTHRTPKYCNSGVPFLSVKNISNGLLNFSETKFISEEEHRELCIRCKPERGDILLSKVGTTGVPAIVDTDIEFSVFVSVALLKFSPQLVNRVYLYYLLKSPLVQRQAKENTRGVGNKNWVLDAITNTVVVLPPLAEQQRIVEKIEQMLPLVEQYGEAYTALESLDARFPEDMRKSILQYAIQGKLVPQRPEEGIAEELYQQIQKEKKKLIAAGKLKKEKPLPPISEEEIPFDIPESWKWVRLGEIVYNRGQCVPQDKFSYIDIGSVDNKAWKLNETENIIEPDKAPSRARKIVGLGDILYSTVRPYLHNMCVIDKEFSCTPIASTGFAVLTCHAGLINEYLFYYMLSPTFDEYANRSDNSKGVAYPAITEKRLLNAVVPLPPQAEQERIAEKLELILPQIGQTTAPTNA